MEVELLAPGMEDALMPSRLEAVARPNWSKLWRPPRTGAGKRRVG